MRKRRPRAKPLDIYERLALEAATRETYAAEYQLEEAARRAKRPRPRRMDLRTCPVCGEMMHAERRTRKTCSAACRQRWHRAQKRNGNVDNHSVTAAAAETSARGRYSTGVSP